MLHLQQKIESLDRLPEYPRIEALEKFQNAIQAINSLVPSDMNLSHSPYLTKMISRFDHKFFEKYQLFLKRTNMTPMLSALAVFLDEQYASTKEYQQINPGNRVSNHSSHGSRPNKITSYATTTTTTLGSIKTTSKTVTIKTRTFESNPNSLRCRHTVMKVN